MSKKVSRGIAGFMLVLAVVFFIYAVSHPEGSFPWSNWITYLIYGIYLAVTVLLAVFLQTARRERRNELTAAGGNGTIYCMNFSP